MTRIAIVYTHPYDGSFGRAILEAVLAALRRNEVEHDVIDLHADGFDPRYTTEELALFSAGKTLDPHVERYQRILERATDLIFINPIWWYDVPATLKGFVDKVMKMDWAYVPKPLGLEGRLTHIRTATAITTSTGPTWYLRLFAGNVVKKVFLGTTLRAVGIRRNRWLNLGRVAEGGQRRRENFLRQAGDVVSRAWGTREAK